MSNPLKFTVNDALALARKIRQAVTAFAARESKIRQDMRGRHLAAERALRGANTRLAEEEGAGVRSIENSFQGAMEEIRAKQAARLEWLTRAERNAERQTVRNASHVKERWFGKQQSRHVAAGREFTRAIEENRAEFTRLQARLAELAQRAFSIQRKTESVLGGYGGLRGALRRERKSTGTPPPGDLDHQEIPSHIFKTLERAEAEFAQLKKRVFSRIGTFIPIAVQLTALAILGFILIYSKDAAPAEAHGLEWLFGALMAASILVFYLAAFRLRPGAQEIGRLLVEAERLQAHCERLGRVRMDEEENRIEADYAKQAQEIQAAWDRADDVEMEYLTAHEGKAERQAERLRKKLHNTVRQRISALEEWRDTALSELRLQVQQEQAALSSETGVDVERLAEEERQEWESLESAWNDEVLPLVDQAAALDRAALEATLSWTSEAVRSWKAPEGFPEFVKFGSLKLDVASSPAEFPKDDRFQLPAGTEISIPLGLHIPERASLLIETGNPADATVASSAFNHVVLRLLASTRPGKLSFTIIDPVGLGQNFAALMHLADYEESLINRRIWTQREQIEERLAELNEHIEKVIQMYLRDEFATIAQYNEQAGSVAEKYHFLVIAGFPAGFSETAVARLKSIVSSGPRCGVFTLIQWDTRASIPEGMRPEDLRAANIRIKAEGNTFTLGEAQAAAGAALHFDDLPPMDLATEFIHRVGKSHVDSTRVEVPFSQVVPAPEERWMLDTTHGLRIPVGRTGATKLQYLAIGKGTRQHALFAGKTGSGKSTLFHVIITNLALACSPEQVEFYLIDFKKGVEFKCYATKRLPHARVVAIESDREFALSVLHRVDEELKRRGDLFREMRVQDLAGYKKAGGKEPLPRTLLIIDEFQEFFVEDDEIAQSASLLLDRLVRQGRAFGIHVLLGSQTLGGAYTLARSTLGQMVVRVALQCNEADSYLIMDENNAAPRLLSRPGEAIYNDAAGAMEGNSPFQVVWLPDSERDKWLDEVHHLEESSERRYPRPVVFEGNAPADVRENDLLDRFLRNPPAQTPVVARAWLGSPNAIKGPTEVQFTPQSGGNLLIVGQREESGLVLLGLSLLAFSAQFPRGTAKFILCHSVVPGTREGDFIEQISTAMPHALIQIGPREIPATIARIHSELKARSSDADATNQANETRVFLLIHGAQRFRKLRNEDEFSFSPSDDAAGANTGAQFTDIILDGSAHGIHILASIDTYGNVTRFLSRKALAEFEMRVLFQMSANDSASLIDSPKGSELGLFRAIFYHESAGIMETFRPYAMPDSDWLTSAAGKLAVRCEK